MALLKNFKLLEKTSENSIINLNESEAENKPDGKAPRDTSIEKITKENR